MLSETIKPEVLAINPYSPSKKINQAMQMIKESVINQSIKEDTQDFHKPTTNTGNQFGGIAPIP